EVLLGIRIDVRSGEEGGVEIARREAERPAFVALGDHAHVRRAELADGAAHAGHAVVIRGDRERPVPEDLVVVAQQPRGGVRRQERIAALVDDVIDPHVAQARRARELPHSGGAGLRVGGRVERGLHVRKRDELRRYAVARENAADVIAPDAGTDETRLEAIGLAELEAETLRGRPELGVARAVRKEREDAALFGAQSFARTAAELRENASIALHGRVDLPAPRGFGGRIANGLIDDVEPLRIVNEAAASIDLGIYPGPELDGRLELLRARKSFLCRRDRRRNGHHEKQAEYGQRSSRHANVP